MIVFVAILFLLLIIKIMKNRSFYKYDVKQSYGYQLPISLKVKIENNIIELPTYLNDSNYTIIAKIKVKSSLLGYFFQPYFKIETKNETLKQYTEHGTKNDRFVNLSNITDCHIKLKGRFLQIKNQEIEITTYKSDNLEGKKILIISPHADDAEIAAYGLYEKYAKDTFIATISASETGRFKYSELYKNRIEHHKKKGDIRVWNSLTVPLLAGIATNNVLNLGYFDDTLEKMFLNKNEEISSHILETKDISIFTKQNFSPLKDSLINKSDWNSLVSNIQMIIDNFKPDIIVSPHPYIDNHEDHQYSTIATIEALQKIDYSNGKLFLYTNHYTDSEYYPYGKIGSIMSLPPKFDNSVYFESLYSNKVNNKELNNKILAFDAMNDLRPNTEYRFWNKLFISAFTQLREYLFSVEKDYFNRYVRSNELFYVVDFKSLSDSNIFNKLMPKNFKDN